MHIMQGQLVAYAPRCLNNGSMNTIDGVPVTEDMIQEWVAEAEKGYDLETLLENGRVVVEDFRL